MHGLVPAKKQFTKADKTAHVRLLRLSEKNAVQRVQRDTDGLLCWALPEPVYEVGTLWIDREGVFFKRRQRVYRLQGVRFDSGYHARGTKCTVLLTRDTHACNVLVVLRATDETFNAINRVPGSRFRVYHVKSSLPCKFWQGRPENAVLVFNRSNPGVAILECPLFKVAQYDKSIFAFVDQDRRVLCEVRGNRYHVSDRRAYYLTEASNEVLCPTFTS